MNCKHNNFVGKRTNYIMEFSSELLFCVTRPTPFDFFSLSNKYFTLARAYLSRV